MRDVDRSVAAELVRRVAGDQLGPQGRGAKGLRKVTRNELLASTSLLTPRVETDDCPTNHVIRGRSSVTVSSVRWPWLTLGDCWYVWCCMARIPTATPGSIPAVDERGVVVSD